MISWKHSFKRLNEEYEIAKKKKQALDNLYNTGKISQSTRDSFNNDITAAIVEIERQQKDLLEKMQLKTEELAGQIKTLESLLANYEIQHVVGEVEEDIYQREILLLTTGLDTAKNELETIKQATMQLCAPVQTVKAPAAPEVPAAPAPVIAESVTVAAPVPIVIEAAPEIVPAAPELIVAESVVEEPVLESIPVEEAPAPVEIAPAIETPVDVAPAVEAVPIETPIEVESAPIETAPLEAAPAPVEEALIVEEAAPAIETPVIEEPVMESAPVEETAASIEESPIVEEPVLECAPVEEVSVETSTVFEVPVEETVALVEEVPVIEEAAPIAPIEPEEPAIEITTTEPIFLAAEPAVEEPVLECAPVEEVSVETST
ncbi:MAG: CdvA-like protein, partial [Candidatus Bathyarchaeia archaeon]